MSEPNYMPGPWSVGYRAMHVSAVNQKIGGEAMVCDIRGWGYLTGRGHGALGLDSDKALAIQQANANLISAAPNLLEALKTFVDEYVELVNSGDAGFWNPEEESKVIAARAAISKAEGR